MNFKAHTQYSHCSFWGSVFVCALFLTAALVPLSVSAYDNMWYPSSVRNAVRSLDDDPVHELSIPVAVGVTQKQLTKNFGDPRGGGTRTHEGLDIIAPRGAPVSSPTNAVVVAKGNGPNSGFFVTTANPGDERFVFMHLDRIAPDIKVGKKLKKGDLIGFVGDTGNAKGAGTHLHFEIWIDNVATDPYPRLTKVFTSTERTKVLTTLVAILKKDLARLK